MRPLLFVLGLVLSVVAEKEGDVQPTWAVTPDKVERARIALAHKWLVGFEKKYASEVRDLVIELGGRVNRQFKLTAAMSVDLPLTVTDDAHPMIKRIENHERVRYVERDHPRFPLAEVVPYGVTTVQSQMVWNSTDVPTKGEGIIVCVIDGGLDRNHEDWVGASITNTNAYSEWNYDGCNHGNHVSGTISAVTFNDIGVASVAPDVSQYIIKVFSTSECNWVASSGLIGAVEECMTEGNSNIISMSLGHETFSRFESDSFQEVWDSNVFSIAAAGNSGDTRLGYPASYDSVFSVAATDSNNRKASFSQYNAAVDIAAPGVGVRSTVTDGNGNSAYDEYSGTSMACPHTAAVAALTWATRPELPVSRVRYCLEHTALDLGSEGRDDSFGWGLVQAYAAHQCALKVYRSTLDCDFVTTDGVIYGFNRCRMSAEESSDNRFSKVVIDGDCQGFSSVVREQYFASEGNCIEGTDPTLQTLMDYDDIICNGEKGDGCQAIITGWTVSNGIDCVNDIEDENYFENESPLFKKTVVLDVCVNLGTDSNGESYIWSHNDDDNVFEYSFFNHLDCVPENIILKWTPPSHCQIASDSADNSEAMLKYLDPTIADGTEVWLKFDVLTGAPTPSPSMNDFENTEAVTTEGPGRIIHEVCSSSYEESLVRSPNGTYLMTNVTFKIGESVLIEKEIHSLFVYIDFNGSMIDEMSVYLYHEDKRALLMRSVCDNKYISLHVRLSDLGKADVAAFCDYFSGSDEEEEALTKEEIDEIFYALEVEGTWLVQFVDYNYDDDQRGRFDNVCMGWREKSNLNSATTIRFSFFYFVMVFLFILYE